jgi:uncharacterized protein
MRAVVLADTHVRAGAGPRRLPAGVYDALGDADLILHAGDVLTDDLLDELRAFAPVHAVLGNNDYGLAGLLPDTRVVDLDGIRVAMVHDSGARAGRAARLHRRFPDADVVVFGHSHMPLNERGIDGQLLFNPGSPTQRRMAPTHTIGILEATNGHLTRADILDV